MIRLQEVSHQYVNGTQALKNLNLEFGGQHFTALIGPSGAGKSTLMRVLNGLVRPSKGRVWLEGTEITNAGDRVVRLERRKIGMVFQQFNLVKRLTAFENVLIGRLGFMDTLRSSLKAYSRTDRQLAMQMLERVGMADQAWQRADTLSGGQQQRVGIARALAQQPKLILADEPISALDPKSSEQVMNLLREIQRQDGIAVLTNLHHLDAVRDYAERVVGLRAGEVVFAVLGQGRGGAMILLDQGPGGRPALFNGAREVIVALRLQDVAPALARLDAGLYDPPPVRLRPRLRRGFRRSLENSCPQSRGRLHCHPAAAIGGCDPPSSRRGGPPSSSPAETRRPLRNGARTRESG